MLYVSVSDSPEAGPRTGYETEDQREAVAQAVASFLSEKPTKDALVIAVLIERTEKPLPRIETAEYIEEIAGHEAARYWAEQK